MKWIIQSIALLVLTTISGGISAQTVEYMHTDALGSVVAVTDSTGTVIERNQYEPYGSDLTGIKDGPGYTGHVSDAATGLSYMQQRYYDPQIGRFLSVDPITADGKAGGNFNRYKYGNNNPYRYVDPDGRCETPTGTRICVQSSVKVNLPDTKFEPKDAEFAKSSAASGAVFSNKASSEKLKAAVEKDGGFVTQNLSNGSTSDDGNAGYSAQGDPPEGARFVLHGHVNKTQVDQAGLGDSQPALSRHKLANVTIGGDKRVGVRKIQGGFLEHQMLRGQMTKDEMEKIQKNLDQAANMYNEITGGK